MWNLLKHIKSQERTNKNKMLPFPTLIALRLRVLRKKKKHKSMKLPFYKNTTGKLNIDFTRVTLLSRPEPHYEQQFLVTCGSRCGCCCLLCFLAGRGGGVSFKGKGSTDEAMTSGQGADGGWMTGWSERVEGNISPGQTGDLCFIGERKGIYVSIRNERIRVGIDRLMVVIF